MLNSQLVAMIQRVTNTFLKDTCTIERQIDAVDEQGAPVSNNWQTVATNVACRVITAGQTGTTADTGTTGQQETITITQRLICETGTTLDTGYRVTVNSDDSVWRVVALVIDRTDANDEQAVIQRWE